MENEENKSEIKSTEKQTNERNDPDESYTINLEKGSPLNPHIDKVEIIKLPNNEIDDLLKNQFVEMVHQSIGRQVKPYKPIIEKFKETKMVAAQIKANGISIKQLSAGLKEAITQCNIEDINVEEIPAKIVLVHKNFNIHIPECDPEDPDFQPTFSL